jgi:hypothetical protein
MFHLCGVDPPRERDVRRPFLWRRPRKRGAQALELRNGRPAGRGDPQPGPYFVLDTGPLAIVGIDTGITGLLDREQGKWLRDVSLKLAKPKVLVTGKPLLVDGQYRPGAIESLDQTVDDIVRNPRHGYVAAIGGDIHNYQRYPVELEGGRCLQYLVAGGGGAFMHATHRIPPVELGDVSEPDFRCFPLRGDSLAFYARAVVPALRRLIALAVGLPVVAALVGVAAAVGLARLLDSTASGVAISAVLFGPPLVGGALLLRYALRSGAFGVRQLRGTTLTPEEAAAYIASSSPDLVPTLSAMMKLAPDKEALAKFVAPRAGAGRGVLHRFFSEIFDVDKPPLYKHALHLEADRETLTIRCYAAIGNEERGEPHQLEDEVQIPLTPARALIARPARDPGAPESD